MTTFEAQPQSAQSPSAQSPSAESPSGHGAVTSAGTGYPTPAWRKAYREGSRPDLRVPYREVVLTNEKTVPLYDTSGPYTDPAYEPDVRRGLPALRDAWIRQRGDVEEYDGREARPEDDGIKHTSPRGGTSATSTRCSRAARAVRCAAAARSRSPSSATPSAAS